LQIDFDPATTTYEKLLEVYWSTHNHCAAQYSRQYMSAVFYADEKQKKIALETREQAAAKVRQRVTTFVAPLGKFYLAESYHQKYMLRQRPDMVRELTAMYPKEKDFLDSTAATRMNGYVGGFGTLAGLQQEIDSFGLSSKGRSNLLALVKLYRK
jgi:hypothetical protein